MAGEVGFMLCGTDFAGSLATIFAELLDLSELGATRTAVDATTNSDAGGWGKILLSCIARLKPFRVTIAYQGDLDWKTAIKAALAELTITWPIEDGFTTGHSIAFDCGLTDISVGGQLEQRTLANLTITPSGEPTIEEGTPVGP